MSGNLYFSVQFGVPLSESEQSRLSQIIDEANRHPLAGQSLAYGGELFGFFADDLSTTQLDGSVGLPVELYAEDIDDFLVVVEHWLDLLAKLRANYSTGSWAVEIDGKELKFDAMKSSYVFGPG